MARRAGKTPVSFDLVQEDPPRPASEDVQKMLQNCAVVREKGDHKWYAIATFPGNKTVAFTRATSFKKRPEVQDVEVRAATVGDDSKVYVRVPAKAVKADQQPDELAAGGTKAPEAGASEETDRRPDSLEERERRRREAAAANA